MCEGGGGGGAGVQAFPVNLEGVGGSIPFASPFPQPPPQ